MRVRHRLQPVEVVVDLGGQTCSRGTVIDLGDLLGIAVLVVVGRPMRMDITCSSVGIVMSFWTARDRTIQ